MLEIPLVLPDLWQQEAVHALRGGKDVVVHAPTGAGKTFIFELLYPSLKGQAIYTVPTRALANDKLAEWRLRGWDVGISTGDLSEKLNARVVVATLETQRSQFLKRKGPRVLIMDEYQMIADPVRGVSYELALTLVPPSTQLLLLSGSVANPDDVVAWLRRLGRDAVLVSTPQRPVPLDEIQLPQLPFRVPPEIRGHWPRLLTAALMADLGPILVFAPRRAAAEELAKNLAAALPNDDSLSLSPEQQALAGEPLGRLLRQRIAYHHSGLSYAARAGLVEPLAKAGQLRIVVATMGLAAGVNFSMRSVLVTDTRYLAGPFERHVQPEELLQMFGRAGRRGLDQTGFVLTAGDCPRLGDSRPARLKRANQVDWPSLISVMHAAGQRGEGPFAAALELTTSLFSRQKVPLGVEASLADGPRACGLWVDAERARWARPRVVEMLNSKREYEVRPPGPSATSLGRLWVHTGERFVPALRLAKTLEGIGEGQLCKLPQEKGWIYGRELPLALENQPGELTLVRWLRQALTKILPRKSPKKLSAQAFEKEVAPVLGELLPAGKLHETIRRGKLLALRVDFSDLPATGFPDRHGRYLANPPERKTYPATCPDCPRLPVCETADASMSPALAWRTLGLIEADGVPTRRGIIFSFFQHGEGLAVAAALEDESYDIGELVFDLANLRAGHRFASDNSPYGGRLGIVCQRAYGHADFPGYLEMGVPIQYGNGASEVVQSLVHEPGSRFRHLNELLRPGDIERALVEWRSILRQISFSPPLEWHRWTDLQTAAKDLAAKYASPTRLEFPPLDGLQRRKISHKLFLDNRRTRNQM